MNHIGAQRLLRPFGAMVPDRLIQRRTLVCATEAKAWARFAALQQSEAAQLARLIHNNHVKRPLFAKTVYKPLQGLKLIVYKDALSLRSAAMR